MDSKHENIKRTCPLKSVNSQCKKSLLQQLLIMFLGGTERQSIFTTSTNMKTVQENVKSLMAASIIPHQNADFSTKAQMKAWVYGGAIPKSVLNYEPLIDEINK